MSRPTVVTTCMIGSSESWLHQQQPYSWHSRAGGGAVHSINSGHFTRHLSINRKAASRRSFRDPFRCLIRSLKLLVDGARTDEPEPNAVLIVQVANSLRHTIAS